MGTVKKRKRRRLRTIVGNERWGFGDVPWKPFETVAIDGEEWELAHGEHPHSRQDQSIYARQKKDLDYVVGFSGHRPLLRIEARERNRLKQSGLSGDEVRGNCELVLFANDVATQRFEGRDLRSCLVRVLESLLSFGEHPIQVWRKEDRDALVGRKVYWHGEPAVVHRYYEDLVEVLLRYDGPRTTGFQRQPWQDDGGDRLELRVDLYDPAIWWLREEEKET
jgi:hypothetical protein